MRFAHPKYLLGLMLLINHIAMADVIPIVGDATINGLEEFQDDTIILESGTGETTLYIGNGPGEVGQANLDNSTITADTSSGTTENVIVGYNGGRVR